MIAALLAAGAARAAPVARDHIEVELVAARDAVAPGERVHVGLRLAHEPHWHTYWVNPGDSGLATKLAWTLPAGVSAGEIEWPAPKRLPIPPLTNFGYDGELVLPVALDVAPDVPVGSTLPLSVKASWLVCKEECIPGDATLTLDLPVRAAGGAPVAEHAALFEAARAAAPRTDTGWTAALRRDGDAMVVTLDAQGAVLDAASLELFAVPTQLFATSRGTVDVAAGRATITTPVSDSFVGMPEAVDLVVAQGDGTRREAVLVRANVAASPVGGAEAPTLFAKGVGASAPPTGGAPTSLLLALVLALVGGVLLNLMPCVFPVLALKALGLAGSAHDRSAARREGLAYLAGVVASFVALALALLALRAGGAALGWGFQLQSPWVVATLALVMVATGLSLSGVWAPGGAWAGAGQSLAAHGGARGAFFTGVLAVVVASPCTAPFMGPALGYAVTQSAAVALLVFATLGVGLAAPLLVLSFAPALARRLPRPGAWMDTLKQVLAFPMYLAALWLFWVLGRQAGVDAMAQALLAALALGFVAWRLGRPAATRPARALRALAIVVGLVACVAAVASIEPRAPDAASTAQDGTHEPWTDARLATLRAEGRPVFVNMTAAWCITCLANERVALSTDAVRDAFAQHGIAYLKGDWTQHDAAITAYLAQFGRNGVPLYVLYPRGGGEPRVLPQMLTPGLVLAALADADARAGAPAAAASPP
ncbi:MAG TPA: protein-disulfide reductase DsbD domain-containing protein [Xanthomonadales bacterium]|nr:protein-disulfide reductase DsbD domain-containing protein [Xanthomonadales bacterium]